jgi:hypothetical protein
MMEALGSPESQFLQEPHGLTSQKMAFFIFNLPHHIPRGHPQYPDGRRPVLFPEYLLQYSVPQLQAALSHSVELAKI